MIVELKEKSCSHDQNTSIAPDKTVIDEQASHSDIVTSVESSEISSDNVNQMLVESIAVNSGSTSDDANTMTISSVENGTLYLLQPLESVIGVNSSAAQNIGCHTLQLLSHADGDRDQGSLATPTVLVATSSADMISNSANLAQLLRSAGITGFKPEPTTQAEANT